ncbi:hypothetical protein KUV57_13655 [Epibacterium sp. DP7N7-1]|nr:hypothetical protein [Epibacterium sp. DP7N7-1]
MRFTTSLIAIMAMLTLSACKSEEEKAREVLADAMQDYALMQDETVTTEDRVIAGRSVSDALERIVNEFGTTDLGLEIASGGTVGQISSDGLRRQIVALENLRAVEMCDEEPTAACVVDGFVAELKLDDRQQFFEQIDPATALLMAMATGEMESAASLFHEVSQEEVNAFALAYAPTATLNEDIVNVAFDSFNGYSSSIATSIAAYRVLTGEDDSLLQEMAIKAVEGRAIIQVFGKDAKVSDQIAELDALNQESSVDRRAISTAGGILNTFGVAPVDDLLLSLLVKKHGNSAVIDALAGEIGGGDFERIVQIFGADGVEGPIKTILGDPQSTPRELSLALMAAAIHLPLDDLRAALGGLEGREVMKWDNSRIYPPLVALAITGDRALYDDVVQTIVPAEIHEDTEITWKAGNSFSEGRMADVVLADDWLFHSTIVAASARASIEQLSSFLDDAASQAGDVPEDYGRGTNRSDVVNAAVSCGVPRILKKMNVSAKDVGLNSGPCDNAHLVARAQAMSDTEFEGFLEFADAMLAQSPQLMLEMVPTAPERAFALVQAMDDQDIRIKLGSFLSILLARQ